MCRGPVCAGQRQADELHAQLVERVAARDLGAVVTLDRQSCFGRCFLGPNVHVRERLPAAHADAADGAGVATARLSAFYSGVCADDADEILTAHVRDGRVIERLVRRIPPPVPVTTPTRSQPDERLATTLARPEAILEAAPEAAPESQKDSEPPADVAPDPR